MRFREWLQEGRREDFARDASSISFDARSLTPDEIRDIRKSGKSPEDALEDKERSFWKHPRVAPSARELKRAWGRHADHDFMGKVVKVHWIKADADAEKKLRWLLDPGNRRNEIAARGYHPGQQKFSSMWGDVGVVVDGRVTIAANSMDDVQSGRLGELDDREWASERRDSGLPRRPSKFHPSMSGAYVLDRESMREKMPLGNEFVVDNWRPVRIIFAGSGEIPTRLASIAQAAGVPTVGADGKPLQKTHDRPYITP